MHILLIEDNEDIRQATKLKLEHDGYEVTAIANGRKAVSICRDADIDAVITDVVMPDQEGIQTIRMLREMEPMVHIIAISGGGQYASSEEYLHIADALGADRTFQKPVDLDDVEHAIEELAAQS
jgi:DNA-binding response OmpR family regulator